MSEKALRDAGAFYRLRQFSSGFAWNVSVGVLRGLVFRIFEVLGVFGVLGHFMVNFEQFL